MNQEQMNSQRSATHGLPPKYPSIDSSTSRPLSILSSSSIPLAPAAYQIWNRPTSMNDAKTDATTTTTNNSPNKLYFLFLNNQPKALSAKNDHGKGKGPLYPPSPQPDNNTNSHTPADHDNNGGHEAHTHAQIQSRGMDPIAYARKLRRTTLNRKASAKARLKKYEYRLNLEKQVKHLEAKKVVLQHQVAMQESEKELLLLENKSLDQLIMDRTDEDMVRDALIKQNQSEVTRLRQLQLRQRQEMQQLLNMQPVQDGCGGVMNPGSNQLGWPKRMVYPNPMQGDGIEQMVRRFNQPVAINPPTVDYGGVAEAEAHYHPEPLNSNQRLQMQAPKWDQFGTFQMPNPNLGTHNPIPNMSNLTLDDIDQILNFD